MVGALFIRLFLPVLALFDVFFAAFCVYSQNAAHKIRTFVLQWHLVDKTRQAESYIRL